MSGRGRGNLPTKLPKPTGVTTRSISAALAAAAQNPNEFNTPRNFQDADDEENLPAGNDRPNNDEQSRLDESINAFINANIPDEMERARRGLDLIHKSPLASQAASQNIDKPSENSLTHAAVERMIAESMKAQTDILTERFSCMMVNCMNQLKRTQELQEVRPGRESVHQNNNIPSSSEPNESFANLFSRRQQSLSNHSNILNQSTRPQYIKKEDFAEIKFDGNSIGVKQFIFKLRTLKEANDVSWDYIVKNFYRCVKGHADTWYWNLVQKLDTQGLKLSWEVLKSALENDFGGRQTDADITNLMWGRKQKFNEPFDDFFNEIIKLNACLSESLTDEEIINILTRNCSNRVFNGAINSTARNAYDFKRKCVKYESEVEKRFKGASNSTNFPKKVSEIENNWFDINKNDQENIAFGENKQHIEALKLNKEKPKVKCGNCHQPVIFCYRCFSPDVTFPNCKNCNGSENSKMSGSSIPPNSHSA